jgi:threonine/homoserine/homoserine lactone efflux protein
VIVNLLNPKTALFFFAFLPQFADPSRGPVALQILLLGLTFIVLGFCSDSMYALAAGTLGNRLRGDQRLMRGGRLFSGSVYIGLGILTAVSGSKRA